MLNILVVTNLYPNKHEPTRGVFTEQIVDKLKINHNVQVVAPIPWFPEKLSKFLNRPIVPKIDTINDTKVYYPRYLVIPKIARSLYGIFFFLGVFRTLRRLKKTFNPDVINVHWMYPDAFGTVLAARLLNIPVVTHSLGCDINFYSKYPARKFFIKCALKWSDYNIAVSKELENKIIALGSSPEKSTTVMNGVNQELFSFKDKNKLRETLSMPLDKKIFLFAGNFNEEKGLEVLIKAFSRIVKAHKNIHLAVVGSGPLELRINTLVDSLGLKESIQFFGRVPHHSVADFLAAADFLCLPSLREGCPNIVLESLSSGTPVLSSNVGAVPEMIASNEKLYGLLAAPGDDEDLARILGESLNSEWELPLNFKWMNWEDSANSIASVLSLVVKSKSNV
jgi:glycosyltransferase involved in cell wall biosynthesis